MMQACRKVFSECSVSCGAIFGSWWVWSLTENASSYTCSILFWQNPVPFLQKTIGAYMDGMVTSCWWQGWWWSVLAASHVWSWLTVHRCLILAPCCWAIQWPPPPSHDAHLAKPQQWPVKPIFRDETVMHHKVLKGSERWNQGGETQNLKCKVMGTHVSTMCMYVQRISNTDLQWCYHQATWGTHHCLHLFCLNLVHVSDDETLPNSMALVESVCVLTPQGCFLTFLLPRVDQGHDLEAFRKKMRAKCHIGHTGWPCGIMCLAHLINVVYDYEFPVN